MDIKVSGHEFFYDITSMSMLFFPGEKTNYVTKSNAQFHISSRLSEHGDYVLSTTGVCCKGIWHYTRKKAEPHCDRKNLVKQTFYTACSKATGIKSPWGILTGIRPLSVYERHRNAGDDPHLTMKDEYYLSPAKIKLLDTISHSEQPYLSLSTKDVSVYISIPFCPGKCSYCSFISVSAVNTSKLLDQYLQKLYVEISAKAEIIRNFGLNVKSIYVGGGTPGILGEIQLSDLLKVIDLNFNISMVDEVCFELGRPETVTAKKLEILRNCKVGRLCINTQSTNDTVLNIANRHHNAQDYFNAVKLTKSAGFDSINTDLIAGLPGEDLESFCNSLDDVVNTGVNNITVHTLAIKRAAKLRDNHGYYNPQNNDVIKMLDYAYTKLESAGFVPYYIYRQKNCVSNGENVGFCKPNKVCKYNIYMMEDVHSIIACGAGASSKIINGDRVTRFINVKYPYEYINEFDKVERNTALINSKLRSDLSNEHN